MKPPLKPPKVWSSKGFQVSEKVWHILNSTGTEAPVLRTLPDLAIRISSFNRLFVSFKILCNNK